MSDIPDPIEPELLSRLGMIVYRWSYVEMLMAEFLSFLLKADPALMYVVTENVSTSTVADWIRTLLIVRHIPHEPPAEIMELLKTVDGLRGERNSLVHGLWSPGHVAGSAEIQSVRWERSEVVKTELVTLADLDELSIEIAEATSELIALGQRYGFPAAPKQP